MKKIIMILCIFGLDLVFGTDKWSEDADKNGNITFENTEIKGIKTYNEVLISGGAGGRGGDGGRGGNSTWRGGHIGTIGKTGNKGTRGGDGDKGLINNGTLNANYIEINGGIGGAGGDGGRGGRGGLGGDGGDGGFGGSGLINEGTLNADIVKVSGGSGGARGRGGDGGDGIDYSNSSGSIHISGGAGGDGGRGNFGGSGLINNGTLNANYIEINGGDIVRSISLIGNEGTDGYGGAAGISKGGAGGRGGLYSGGGYGGINNGVIRANIIRINVGNGGTFNNGGSGGLSNNGVIQSKNLILDSSKVADIIPQSALAGGRVYIEKNLTIKSVGLGIEINNVVFTDSNNNDLPDKTLVLETLSVDSVSKFTFSNPWLTYSGFIIGNKGIRRIVYRNYNNIDVLKLNTINAYADSEIAIENEGVIFVNNINASSDGGIGLNNNGIIRANSDNLNIYGDYGNGKASGISNSGIIEAKNIVFHQNSSSGFLLENAKWGKIESESIFLNGGNAIKNDGGSVITSNLILTNTSSIDGEITLDPSKESSLVFTNINFDNWSSDPNNPFLDIKNATMTLNPNTNLSIDFNMTTKQLLESNLTYGASYLLATGIVDNRDDKQKNVVNSFMVDGVLYSDFNAQANENSNNLSLVFEPIKNQSSIDSGQSAFLNAINNIINQNNIANKDKVGHSAIDGNQADVQRILNNVNQSTKNADKILSSMLESNKFQNIAIGAGIKQALGSYDSEGKKMIDYSILNSLVSQTNATLAAAVGNSVVIPLRISQYTNEQIQSRINSLLLSRFSYSIVLKDKIVDVSLEQLLKSMKKIRGNTLWLNVGGSYFQGKNNNNLGLGNASFGYDRNFDLNDISSLVVGGIFNYSYGQYNQNYLKEKTNAFTLGLYTQYEIEHNEIQGAISQIWMIGNGTNNVDIQNSSIGIHHQTYQDNTTSFDLNLYYKYRFDVAYNQRIKPLFLLNYTLISMPRQQTELFDIQDGKNNILALGVGAEYIINTKYTSHTLQAIAKNNFLNTMNSRGIAFNGSNTYVDYEFNLPSFWFRFGYTGSINIKEYLSMNLSVSTDLSNDLDFGLMGNLGIKWVF